MTSPEPRSAALLYSGGTDSTLVAVKAAQRFQEVHLLTYTRLGMFGVENSERNLDKLREIFGSDRFVRPPVMEVDRLFRHVAYQGYVGDVARHRGAVLTTCGQCKLAMHLRTLVYCVDHGVDVVWDGANRHMTIFPAQMEEVLAMLRDLYARVGVSYENPVYDYEDTQGIDFGSGLWGLSPAREAARERAAGRTTGDELHELGILPEPDVKGTDYDKTMQGRCYQFALFNLWARWWALERRDMDEYRRRVIAYYRDRIGRLAPLVDELARGDGPSTLRALCEEAR